MKRTLSLLLTLFLLGALCVVASADNVEEYAEVGITLHNNGFWEECEGQVELEPYGALQYEPDIYYLRAHYLALTDEEYEELSAKAEDEFTEEDINHIILSQAILGHVLITNGAKEDLSSLFDPGVDIENLGLIVFGNADGYTFYFMPVDVEDYRESLGDDWSNDFVKAEAILEQLLHDADLYAPVDPDQALVGTVIQFETTDLDRNVVTSEELFADNEVTMINYWGTWCHYCVEEMSALAEIHTRLQEKGCGIVGILQDGYDEEHIQLARDIMQENGTNYPNVLSSGEMTILDDVKGFPTSYFVDRNGTLLCPPISGVGLDLYEETVDKLLSGESANQTDMEPADANGENVFRVIVTDSNGEPVQGVLAKMCDDTTCNLSETDENGIAVFELPEGKVYSTELIKVPDGYEKDDSEYLTLDVYSDVIIVLKQTN